MTITSKITFNVDKIMTDRGLGNSNRAAVFAASEVRRLCRPYVPFQQGTLEATAQVVGGNSGAAYVVYNQPYAHYQYAGEVYGPNVFIAGVGWRSMAKTGGKKPTGREITYTGAPMRGKLWDKRMMADRGEELTVSVARYVGGVPG